MVHWSLSYSLKLELNANNQGILFYSKESKRNQLMQMLHVIRSEYKHAHNIYVDGHRTLIWMKKKKKEKKQENNPVLLKSVW